MTEVAIRSEPRVYEPHGDHSFFIDHATMALGATHPRFAETDARLGRYMAEIDTEIRDRSIEGRRAESAVRELHRGETRAASTGSTSLGAFVTPQYLTELYAAFRSPERSFTNQCHTLPMPDVGMTLYLPTFTGAASAGKQATQNTGTDTASPSGADLPSGGIPVVTQAGTVVLSQALFGRGGFAGGGGFDQIAIAQINQQLDAAIDTYVLAQALATAAKITDATTLTIANFFADMSTAREKLTDTAGTRLFPTHVFTTSDLLGWLTKQVDKQTRPIFLPDAAALVIADGNPKWAGWSGMCLPGGVQWFTDDNILAKSTNTSVVVARPSEVYVWEGDPITFAYPETNAGNLSVVVGLRKYLAAQPRYTKAVSYITGAGYPTSLK